MMTGRIPKRKVTSRPERSNARRNPEDSFGTATGNVNVVATARVPVFAIGITKKLTLGLAVPVIKSDMKVALGVIQENESLHQEMIGALNASGASSKVEEFMRVHPPIFSGVPCLNRMLLHSNQPPSLV